MAGVIARPEAYSLRLDPVVNRNAIEVLAGRQRGLDRPMAFAILDAELCRLAKAQGVLDLLLGKALAPLLDGGYEALGSARLADYCVEHLSFTRRTAELLRQQADRMDRYPVVRQAFLDATINQSHARVLLAHLERYGGDEADLVALAATLTVRGLKERLEPQSVAEGGDSRREVSEPIDPDAADAAGERREPEGQWRHYRLGPEHLAEWEQIVERCKRVEGGHLEPWEVLEILAADFLSGAPLASEVEAGEGPGVEQPPKAGGSGGGRESSRESVVSDGAASSGGGGSRWDRQRPGVPIDWRKMLEQASGCWRWLDALPVRVDVDADLTLPVPEDPFEAHELACKLVLCRRRLDLYIGRMLRTLDHCGLVRQAEFAGMSHYAAERLGLGASTTARLLRRARTLASRPMVFQAIADGRIGVTQADQLALLPGSARDDEWIAWAGARTCRAVEDAVRDLILIGNLDPEYMRGRGWHPPADGEDLPAVAEGLATRRSSPAGSPPVQGTQGGGQRDGTMNRTPGSGPMSSPDGGQRPDVLPMFSQAGGRLAVLPMFSQADGRLDLLSMFSQAGDRLDLLSMFSQAGDRPDMLSMFSQAGDRRSSASGAGLRMFIPFELLPVLVEAEAAASRVAGRDLSPEECLWAFIAEIKGTYTEFEKRLDAKRRRALRRARYRCQAPGCRNRRGLHAHHIVFRSHGGSNADENFVVLCPAHHLRGVHGGRMRVRGPASDLVFEVGLRAGQPYMVFHGDVRVA